ncbi:hypothetical protein ACFU98_09620 [Streptomyces sp. NPDC057575]|uniref:hypothetical protein n=1 Tax=unclassified Streptomyces TaxID=2593676 RepID=UPI00367C8957
MGIGIHTSTCTGVLAERQVYLDSHPDPPIPSSILQQHRSAAAAAIDRGGNDRP